MPSTPWPDNCGSFASPTRPVCSALSRRPERPSPPFPIRPWSLVATVSHELKTPLTSLRMALHLLLEETVGPLTSKQTELLLDARDNGERLLGMVNNLLDLTRLEQGSGHLELQPEQPGELVRSVA